jgi:hypothetical protein
MVLQRVQHHRHQQQQLAGRAAAAEQLRQPPPARLAAGPRQQASSAQHQQQQQLVAVVLVPMTQTMLAQGSRPRVMLSHSSTQPSGGASSRQGNTWTVARAGQRRPQR